MQVLSSTKTTKNGKAAWKMRQNPAKARTTDKLKWQLKEKQLDSLQTQYDALNN
jgi:hypothetical protein